MAAQYESEHGRLLDTHALLNQWRHQNTLVDFTIITADKQSFPVHKCYIALWSEYFKTLFTGSPHFEKSDHVELKDVRAEDLEPVLNYIYGEQMVFPDDIDKVRAITEVAAYLQVTALLRNIGDNIIETINIDNCLDYNALIEMYELDVYRTQNEDQESLSDVVNEFALQSWEILTNAGKAHLLPKDAYVFALSNQYCQSSCEMIIYNDICQWLSVNPGRLKHAHELMSEVKFPLMSSQELKDILEGDSPVLANTKVREMIEQALDYVTADMAQKVMKCNVKNFLRTKESLFIFGGFSSPIVDEVHSIEDDDEDVEVEVENEDEDEVVEIEKDSGDEAIEDEMRQPTKRCAVMKDKEWVQLPDIPHTFDSPAVASLRGFVFVCGGWEEHEGTRSVSRTVHCFDPRSWTWGTVCPMIKSRAEFPVVLFQGQLYAIGGLAAQHKVGSRVIKECEDTIECYDPDRNAWSVVQVMKTATRGHVATAWKSMIYIYGGWHSNGDYIPQFMSYKPNGDITYITTKIMHYSEAYNYAKACRMLDINGYLYLYLINQADSKFGAWFVYKVNRAKHELGYSLSDGFDSQAYNPMKCCALFDEDLVYFGDKSGCVAHLEESEFQRSRHNQVPYKCDIVDMLRGWSDPLHAVVRIPHNRIVQPPDPESGRDALDDSIVIE